MMQLSYKLDLAIIQFSEYDNPLPLHTNKSIFSTIRSTTTCRPSSLFSKNSEEVIIFQQLTNQTSPEVSIDTKFQESCKFTSTYYLFRTTAFRWSFIVSLWVHVEKVERRSFSLLFPASPRISICKVIWSNSEHWYQLFSFLGQNDANIL